MKKVTRLWTLGDIKNGIVPSKAALDKLREILKSDGHGIQDIVWGDDLKLTIHEYDDCVDEIKIEENTAVIFGVGQDGIYLSKLLLSKGYRVIGVNRRSSQHRAYLEDLVKQGLELVEGDITDAHSVNSIISKYKPKMAFNLAAMSHVHTSFSSPASTFEINTIGLVNILESIRLFSPNTRLYHASTSEMFGKNFSIVRKCVNDCYKKNSWDRFPACNCPDIRYQDENTPMGTQSPYAAAKLAAHNMVRLYRESYGLFCCSGILFNHESEHRGVNFLTRKVTKYVGELYNAIQKTKQEFMLNDNIKCTGSNFYPKLKLGNLDACRDWSHAEDMVKAMVLMLEAEYPDDYVVGSGETHTVKEFVKLAFEEIGENWEDWVEIDQSLIRPAEVDYLCAKPDLVKSVLGWEPKVSFQELVKRMVANDIALARKNS